MSFETEETKTLERFEDFDSSLYFQALFLLLSIQFQIYQPKPVMITACLDRASCFRGLSISLASIFTAIKII